MLHIEGEEGGSWLGFDLEEGAKLFAMRCKSFGTVWYNASLFRPEFETTIDANGAEDMGVDGWWKPAKLKL